MTPLQQIKTIAQPPEEVRKFRHQIFEEIYAAASSEKGYVAVAVVMLAESIHARTRLEAAKFLASRGEHDGKTDGR